LFGSGCQPPDQLRGYYTENRRKIQCNVVWCPGHWWHNTPRPFSPSLRGAQRRSNPGGGGETMRLPRPDLSGLAMTSERAPRNDDGLSPTYPNEITQPVMACRRRDKPGFAQPSYLYVWELCL